MDALTAHMKDGRIADGFVAATARCGAVLAAHAPGAPGGKLPDRIYLL
jgi:putative membrane protein